MKIKHECIPCLMRQSVDVSHIASDDIIIQNDIIKNASRIISQATFDETAVFLAMKIHKYAKKLTGHKDPYKDLKKEYNKIADELIEDLELERLIKESTFPFEKACRLAIAGNIIDFGLGMNLDKEKVNKSISESLSSIIFGCRVDYLYDQLRASKRIMILTDNAGEIVFDKLLIKELLKIRIKDDITYVVKGGPIVNDATIEDAIYTGVTELVNVIDNGLEAQGTLLDLCSDDFIKEFKEADIIISKGQANYETLSHLNDPRIYYMLRAKCQCVADDIGCSKNDFVIINRPNQQK